MIKIKIERHFQTLTLGQFGITLYLGLWWPRKLWSRDLALVEDEFIFALGPVSVLVY